eukprot:1162061-Pelagomonas_calceolata.AAC.2
MAAQRQKRRITCSNEKGPGKHSWHCVAATCTHRWLYSIKVPQQRAPLPDVRKVPGACLLMKGWHLGGHAGAI